MAKAPTEVPVEARDIVRQAERMRRGYIVMEGPERDGFINLDLEAAEPYTMLVAFTCELYLKALIKETTGELAIGHDLRKLFAKLPVNVKDITRKAFKDNHIQKVARDTVAAAAKERGERPFATDFAGILDAEKNVFVRVRYRYESPKQAESVFIGHISEALRKALYFLYPTKFEDVRLPLPENRTPGWMANSVRLIERPADT